MTKRNKSTSPAKQPSAGLGKPRAYMLIMVLVALVLIGVADLLLWVWTPTLPNPIATHWGTGTSPNGFESPLSFILTISVIMGATVFLLGAIGFSASRSAVAVQVIGGATVFIGAMVLLLVIVSIGPQRGLADAKEATLSGGAFVLILAVPAALGLVAALLAPKEPPVSDAAAPPPPDAVRADLAPDEEFLWIGKTSVRPGFLWGSTIAFVVIFGGVAAASGIWALALFALLPLVLTFSLASFTVQISQAGLFVTSPIGWPKRTITSAQIEQASAVDVHPLQEFGGWGYRITIGGAEGIVLRKGPGIRIEYGANSVLVITLNEGADEAAALLNTAADWAHQEDSEGGA